MSGEPERERFIALSYFKQVKICTRLGLLPVRLSGVPVTAKEQMAAAIDQAGAWGQTRVLLDRAETNTPI